MYGDAEDDREQTNIQQAKDKTHIMKGLESI